MPRAEIDDTYAEAFRSIYAEVLITARDRRWLDEAVRAATGNASSTILCDCEAGLDRYVGPGGDESFATPDGRPGAVVQFHVPRFRKDRVEALERAVLVRVSQNVLTCPTTACFNVLTRQRDVLQAGPQGRVLRRRPPVPRRALRPQGLGGADPVGRVRHRAARRLSRRADGRQPVVLRGDRGRGARGGRPGGGGGGASGRA